MTWTSATLGVVGCGRIGGKLSLEAVRSGASVQCWDFDIGTAANASSQITEVGVPKVQTLTAACEAIRPCGLQGHACDVRHAGIGQLRRCNLLMDCSDDPALTWPLTEIANGLGIDMLRLAVDGTGQLELGRVTHASGGDGACAMCSYSLDDIQRFLPRTGCPVPQQHNVAPTLASGSICGGIAHLGLLQAQRLVKGQEADKVRGREVLLDWTHFQMFSIELRRSENCLSGHERWKLHDLNASADATTFGDLFGRIQREIGGPVKLSGYLHPLNAQAVCECGESVAAIGTDWAVPPACRCGRAMRWMSAVQVHQVTQAMASELNINDFTLAELGYPVQGAMFEARVGEQSVKRFVLR
jgi:hypothetical protein